MAPVNLTGSVSHVKFLILTQIQSSHCSKVRKTIVRDRSPFGLVHLHSLLILPPSAPPSPQHPLEEDKLQFTASQMIKCIHKVKDMNLSK